MPGLKNFFSNWGEDHGPLPQVKWPERRGKVPPLVKQKYLYFKRFSLDVRERNCDNILGHILHFKTMKVLCFME